MPQPDSDWLGFRPSLPDGLPVVGPSSGSPRVVYAFGHQHLGVTLGGVTGSVVADLVVGRVPPVDLTPYSPRRF
ncbi:glycine/D-amino acid oxidase-like deaminating enzyme [Paraburkholderia sp. UCT70]|uniref:NAD(P)/FAD-dependent oxidoreductase n=1 Tax=Paraburkholderia sp. UCT70 TaxID=2991068 RepID=UPI003D229184